MAFRKADHPDIRALAELWGHSFPGARTVAERTRQLEQGMPYGGIESAWVEEENGRLIGAFRAYRMTQYIAGVPLPMLGLASVAVSPGARRRGLARRMCREALRIGYQRGDVLSTLYPFRPAFYHSLGWGLVGTLHSHKFRPESLADADEARAVRPAEPADRPAIMQAYAKVAERSNGLLRRAEPNWAVHLDAPGAYAFVYDDGGVHGYVLARYGRARSPEARVLQIRELIAENEGVYRGLLGWIAAQRDQWRLVRYDARPEENFGLRLADPRPPLFRPARTLWAPVGQLIRGPMVRVLNVEKLLEARWRDTPGVALSVEVVVEDREIPENRGPWQITLAESGARVRKGQDGADVHLVTDAPTFAQIVCGELSPTDAVKLGSAEVAGSAAVLDTLFRTEQAFWLLDEF